MAEHEEECTCDGGIPENALILNVLHLVEWIDPDSGTVYKSDFSADNSGEEIEYGKFQELVSWLQMIRQAPILADLIAQLNGDDCDE